MRAALLCDPSEELLSHWYFYCPVTKWHRGYRAVSEVWFNQVSERSHPVEQNPSGNTAGCQLVRWSLALQWNVKPRWPSQSIYTSRQSSRVTHSDYRTGPIQWSNAASAVLGLPQKGCPKRVFVFKYISSSSRALVVGRGFSYWIFFFTISF